MSNDAANKKFEEALHLLNEAAKDKKEEIQSLLQNKYSNIKDAIEEVTSTGKNRLNRIKRLAGDSIEEGQERIEEVLEDVDKRVRKDPWPYLGGVALGALLLGFIMGSSRK